MGMYDKEKQLTKTDFAADEGGFLLFKAEYLGVHNHAEYGENAKARVEAAPLSARTEVESYVVFGVLAEQVSRMEDGDVPKVVRIGQDGRANVWEPVRDLTEEEKIPF